MVTSGYGLGRTITKMGYHTFLFEVELKDQKHQIDESKSTIDKADLLL